MSQNSLPRPARVAGVVFGVALGAIVIAVLAGGAWVGVRGVLAYTHLRDAQATVASVTQSLDDPARASALIDDLSANTAAARALTSDPVWRLAEGLPWLGPQLAAVSTVSRAIDDVASEAMDPLVDVASTISVDSFRPVDERIDLAGFAAIQDAATTAADGVAGAAASVDAIDRSALLGPLRDAVGEVRDVLGSARTSTDALARASVLLPRMLGQQGPRDYLVLFQNNAEWRSLGGMTGAMALVHTDGGALSLAGQKTASEFGAFDEAVVPLDDDVLALYGDRPGRWMHNTTLVPDFAVGGPVAREMWRRKTGVEVDGVMTVDPVALSYLLDATGPLTLPSGDVLTSENAVSTLLNEVYLRYDDPVEQDAFFAAAAASVFDALKSGRADPAKLVEALARAGDERRLLLWSAHDDDRSVLEGTTLAGRLPDSDAETARFGVFLNDGTGSKMDYYLTADTALAWDECTVDAAGRASGTATLTLTLASDAPADAASLPLWVNGGGWYGVPPGTARTVGYLYLPEGFDLAAAQITGDVGFGGGTHEGRRVLSFTVDLAPGQSATATVSARTTSPSAPTLEVQRTPTIAGAEAVAAVCGRP